MQEMIDEGSEINDFSLTSINETLDRFDPSPDYYHIVAVKVLINPNFNYNIINYNIL